VPATAKRLARTARLTVRCMPVRLSPPRARRGEKLPEVEVFAIHALETDASEGVESLEWLLLSSVLTHTHEEALERLAWYARRWTIESWHRVLKSGCRVEARQFGNLDRFVRATALFAVISWRILYATLLARLDGELPWKYCCSRSNGVRCTAAYTALSNCRPSLPRWLRSYCGSPGSADTSLASTTTRLGRPSCGAAFLPCTKSPRCIEFLGRTSEVFNLRCGET
jgi:hypothetical protein